MCVAMLSSGLRSKRAVQLNILIVRAFIRLREYLLRKPFHNSFRGLNGEESLNLSGRDFVIVSAYIEDVEATPAPPTVKQHLAAIRMLFDWFVIGQVMEVNPASSVRGPKHVVKRGKTPVLTAAE